MLQQADAPRCPPLHPNPFLLLLTSGCSRPRSQADNDDALAKGLLALHMLTAGLQFLDLKQSFWVEMVQGEEAKWVACPAGTDCVLCCTVTTVLPVAVCRPRRVSRLA